MLFRDVLVYQLLRDVMFLVCSAAVLCIVSLFYVVLFVMLIIVIVCSAAR